MTDVARAKALLVDSNYTVVLCRDEITYTDTRRGFHLCLTCNMK